MLLDCGGRPLDLGRVAVMGILNTTPDSFSDGGIFLSREKAIAHAVQMVDDGDQAITTDIDVNRPNTWIVNPVEVN